MRPTENSSFLFLMLDEIIRSLELSALKNLPKSIADKILLRDL